MADADGKNGANGADGAGPANGGNGGNGGNGANGGNGDNQAKPTIEDAIHQAIKDKLNPDDEQMGNNKAKAIRISGYRGKSDFDTWTRLYLNEQFDEYIEVSSEGIIAEVNLAGNESPHILLLIDPDADIHHVMASAERLKAGFLGGDIAQRHLRGNRPAGSPYQGPRGMAAAPTTNCGSFGMACGSFGMACGSFGMACGSFGMACGSFGMAC